MAPLTDLESNLPYFEASFSYESSFFSYEEKGCLQNGHSYKRNRPCFKRPLNRPRSALPLLICKSIVIQMGGVCHRNELCIYHFQPRMGTLSHKYRDRNGRCAAIVSRHGPVRGRRASLDWLMLSGLSLPLSLVTDWLYWCGCNTPCCYWKHR